MTVSMLLSAATATLISLCSLVLVTAAMWWIDRYDREPNRLVVLGFLVGATVALVLSPTLAGVVRTLWPAGIHGAEVEPWLFLLEAASCEVLKGLVVVLIVFFGADLDNPTDGVVYGVATAAGYALTANLLLGSTWEGVGSAIVGSGPTLLVLCFVAGVHLTSGAAFGGSLGMARLTRSGQRVAWVSGGVAAAVIIHAGWVMVAVRLAGGAGRLGIWPALLGAQTLLFTLTIGWFFRMEHRILGSQLGEEVEFGVVPSWVADVIPYYRHRVRSSWWPDRRERTVLARLMSRLAFRKHIVRGLPEGEAQIAGLEVVQLRHRIRKMLDPGSGDD